MLVSAVDYAFWLRRALRSCVNCGQYSFCIPDTAHIRLLPQLCEDCYSLIEIYALSREVSGYEFKVFSLFSWDQLSDNLLRNLLLGLKGGGPREIYSGLVDRLCLNRLNSASEKEYKNFQVVPAAPRRENFYDHAHALAKGVATTLNAKFCPVLIRNSKIQQKLLSESERRSANVIKNSMKLKCDQSINCEEPVIFVDDIITTGTTALAAFEALGRPKRFEVWVIAHRPRFTV